MNPSEEWSEWLRDWPSDMKLHSRRQDSTITVYLRGAQQFTAWLAEHHPEARPADVTRAHVRDWIGSLRSAGIGDSTRRVRLMSLRVLFDWLASEAPTSGVTSNPADNVEAPMPELPRARIPADDDIHAVLRTCRDRANFSDVRDLAIIRLMLATGLRRGEVCSIDCDRIDFRGRELEVTGKGDRPRVVPMFGEAELALSRYRRMRPRRAAPNEPAFFVSFRTGRRLTGGAIAEMLERRCVAAGVERIRPHSLRHYWAHSAKEAGLRDEDISVIGGWRSPVMLARYGRDLSQRRALEAVRGARIGDGL